MTSPAPQTAFFDPAPLGAILARPQCHNPTKFGKGTKLQGKGTEEKGLKKGIKKERISKQPPAGPPATIQTRVPVYYHR